MESIALLFFGFLYVSKTNALSYGVANTPPMGWSSWMVFQCHTYCTNSDYDPMCFSENSIKQIVDKMRIDGYQQAGYEYIILDDCWQNSERVNYRLVEDRARFPNEISGLAQYVHGYNLKLGIFTDLSRKTGQGFPGSYGFLEEDAKTFISWGVDYIKMSSCDIEPTLLDYLYPEFGRFLERSPRQILYAVSWPVYKTYRHFSVDYYSIRNIAHTWRFYGDAGPDWNTLVQIMDYYTAEQATLIKVAGRFAGRGGWNDPDVLLVGNPRLTYDQAKVQMAIWCIMAAPLIISTDIRYLESRYKEILLNSDAISINQDRHGLPGYRLLTKNSVDVWVRKIHPYINGQYSYALAFVNRNTDGSPVPFSISLSELEMNNPTGYYVKEIFTSQTGKGAVLDPSIPLQAVISPMSVVFYKLEVIPPSVEQEAARFIIQGTPEIIRYRY